MPIRILVTEGTRADRKEAVHLIEGISAETLLADRGYDTNDILSYALSAGIKPIEQAKITCAKKLFASLSSADVVYDVVKSYQELLNIMEK